jgi:hypothetical protein
MMQINFFLKKGVFVSHNRTGVPIGWKELSDSWKPLRYAAWERARGGVGFHVLKQDDGDMLQLSNKIMFLS